MTVGDPSRCGTVGAGGAGSVRGTSAVQWRQGCWGRSCGGGWGCNRLGWEVWESRDLLVPSSTAFS